MSNFNTPYTRTLVATLVSAVFTVTLTGCQTTPRQQQSTLGDWYETESIAQKSAESKPEQNDIKTPEKLQQPNQTPKTAARSVDEQLSIYQSARNSIDSGTGSPELKGQLDTKIIALQIQKADAQYEEAPDQPVLYRPVITQLKTWLDANPAHPYVDQYRYQLARIQAIIGDNTEAESTLESLQVSKANLPSKQQQEIDFRLGENAFSQRNYGKAVGHYTSVLRGREDAAGDSGESRFAYNKAMYMRAWSHLQENEFKNAANDFLQLLTQTDLQTQNPQMKQDIYRGLILAVNDAGGVSEIPAILDMAQFEPISMDIYARLIDFYTKEKRWSEVISAYQAYQTQYPNSENALAMATQLLTFLEKNNQKASLRKEKASFIHRYAAAAPKKSAEFALELAEYHRAEALKLNAKENNAQQEFAQSISYYEIYLKQFKTQANSSSVLFAYAETLLESGNTAAAQTAFNQVAKSDAPLELRQKSAYFALASLDGQIDTALESSALESEKMTIAENFVRDFPDHPKVPQVLNWLMVHNFKMNKYPAAMDYAQKLQSSEKFGHAAYQVNADSLFATKDWIKAAKAYEQLLGHAGSRSMERAQKNTWRENTLKAYYQAARQAKPSEAQPLFAIIYNSKDPELAPAALYDAAILSESSALKTKDSAAQSITLYKRYLREYPSKSNAQDVRLKLANIYKNTEQWQPAAVLLQQAAQSIEDPELQHVALLEVAELFQKAQNTPEALRAFKAYIQAASGAQSATYESIALAQAQVISLEKARGNTQTALKQMDAFVLKDLQSSSATAKTREAAQAYAIELAEKQHRTYKRVRITRDLRNSFQRKQKALEQAIARYKQVSQFNTPKTNAIADAGIGNLFAELSNALLNAPVPPGMSELEEEEYMLIIEEQAFPFEEKALDSHTLNVTRLHNGNWSEGIEQSLETLRSLMPARFDKKERFEGAITHAE